jgi:hypothetical protein
MARTRAFQALAEPRPTTTPPGATPPVGDVVEALLREAARHNGDAGWRVLMFHLSKLQRVHRRDKHLQIAANMLQDLVKQHSGSLFQLPNHDLAVVCKGIRTTIVDDAISTLKYLFNDDAFARRAVNESDFCSSFDLEKEHARFVASLRKPKPQAPRAPTPTAIPDDAPAPAAATDPAGVAELLTAVRRLDLAPILRRQTAWRMIDGREPQPHSEELFVSIKALREAIGPAFAPANDRQLFAYVTRLLDSFMLKTISWEHFSVGAPLSFNINLETLRTAEFEAFDRRRPRGWHGRVMLELQLADVWGDFPAFLEASQHLKRQGYLRCLDGVVFSALRFLNLRRLEIDVVKLSWTDELLKLGDDALRELYQAIAECGAERIILTRCGREEALRIGRLLGIRIFQGWVVNSGSPRATAL